MREAKLQSRKNEKFPIVIDPTDMSYRCRYHLHDYETSIPEH